MGKKAAAYLSVLREMVAAEDRKDWEDAELACEGLTCYLGARRVSRRTVRKLLTLVALHADSLPGAGRVERYTINGVGRALVDRPEIESEIRAALLRGTPWTVVDRRIVAMAHEADGDRPAALPKAEDAGFDLLWEVNDFRKGILSGGPSTLMCDAVCYPLQGYLSFAAGLETTVVKKFFQIPGGELEHVWLQMEDGSIIDPTADQLQEHGYPKLPPVYIGRKPAFYPE